MNIAQNILTSLEKNHSNHAFCIEDIFYTYDDFSKCISNIQNAIQTTIKDDEYNIGLITNNDLETYASIIALWLEGKAYIPLNPSTPKTRNISIIEQSEILTVIDSSNNSEYSEFNIINSKSDFKSKKSPQITSKFNNSNLAYVFFTSGTTGTPKGVQITHDNLESFTEAFWNLNYTINSTDRCLQMFDLTFDLSVVSYLAPLLKGACIYTVSNTGIKYLEVLKLISNYELTFTLMVPSILHSLRPFFRKINSNNLKFSMFCGEALHLDIIEEWSKCIPNATIANVYGPTECTIYCTNYIYNRNGKNKSHNGILSVGKDMLNTKTIIINKENKLLNNNEEGELCLSGTQLTKGYWKNEMINKKSFFSLNIDGINTRFYKTGDLCKKDDNGDLLYLGRMDFQAKVQGYRVELSEIEFYSKKIISTVNLVAVIINNKLRNTEVALAIESSSFDTDDFVTKLKSYLPIYMVPTKILFYDALPLNVNGKIDRKHIIKAIEEKYGS